MISDASLSDSTLPTVHSTNVDSALTTACSIAHRLGLTGELHVALELQSLNLIQDAKQTREISGPLLLCQDIERLILIAYQGDQPRQNPWAFTPADLNQIVARGHLLELILKGERQMVARLEDPELVQLLVHHLEAWCRSH